MPLTTSSFVNSDPYSYLDGFPSYHSSEAIPDALPVGQNNPQIPPYGLYAEKLSGSAFTAPRHSNRQTWLYRILPSASHTAFEKHADSLIPTPTFHHIPNQFRWDPFEIPASNPTFVEGIHPLCGTGSAPLKNGLQISVYTFTKSMDEKTAFYSADGDWLIVPQMGDLDVRTELGRLYVRPLEILVIPRGIRFNVALAGGDVGRGYILETFNIGHFELPELGPMGSNALANPRDFQIPKASYIDSEEEHTIIVKQDSILYSAKQNHSPFDVVAWHGNYFPMKYDLGRFNTMGSISYDHPDPSIFTVLTLPSPTPGTAIADFVCFPPRWLVGENTFRPPWYHRNTMSEFMGLISGDYDAKTAGGFVPGGASLHNVMAGHGPDADTAEKASNAELKPMKVGAGSMAFMFESMFMVGVTEWGLGRVQKNYEGESWGNVKRRFKAPDVAAV